MSLPYSLYLHFVPYGRFYIHVQSDLMLKLIIVHKRLSSKHVFSIALQLKLFKERTLNTVII